MTPHPHLSKFILTLLLLSSLVQANAQNYFVIELSELKVTNNESEWRDALARQRPRFLNSVRQPLQIPSVRIDAKNSQGFVAFPWNEDAQNNFGWASQDSMSVALLLEEAKPVSGTITIRGDQKLPMEQFAFEFDPSTVEVSDREAFEAIRQSHYASLSSAGIPGTAWFRHQAGAKHSIVNNRFNPRRNRGDIDHTFRMFSGNRAVAENLALDRQLILAESKDNQKQALVDITSIRGVTVSPIDWSGQLSQKKTSIDTLAKHIPEDQYAAFFSSIAGLNKTLAMIEKEQNPILSSRTTINRYKYIIPRYQKQMGIQLSPQLTEQMPIQSVAITGGDPFFPSGTDIAVIFETTNPDIVYQALSNFVALQAKILNAKEIKKDGAGFQSSQYTNIDRSFSSHILKTDHYVAISNSAEQIEALLDVRNDKTAALGETDEFKFFRQRYPLEEAQTAFLFLSDATIRHWASPSVRIGASRRIRAAAALADLAAQEINNGKLGTSYEELLGETIVEGTLARSEYFNTLNFLTPISELQLDQVTELEKNAYERWRRNYESNWSVNFDPIALSIDIKDSSLAFDLSVIPLTTRSDYDNWIELAGDATLDLEARSPHPEALLFTSFAIDSESAVFAEANSFSQSMIPALKTNPLEWVEGSISIFVDNSPFWKEFEQAERPNRFMEHNIGRFPLGLRIASKSALRLAVFMTGIRSYSDQAAPGLLKWETREHNETPYVVVSAEDVGMGINDFSINYAAQSDALLLSLNEKVLHRAMDRAVAANEDTESESEELAPLHAFGAAKLNFLQSIQELEGNSALERQQAISWSALPILNEWKQRHPDLDPVKFHQTHFSERIECPSGQGYQWNEVEQTMESITYGHPAAPRAERAAPTFNDEWTQAQASLHFENDGLRLKAELKK